MSTESVASRTRSGAHRVPAARDRRAVASAAVAAGGRAWIWALAGGLFVLYATVSIRRHLRIQSTGFDLGLNEQAVRGYAHWSAPIVELKSPGENFLGDHFSPILATIGPIYRIFPSPLTLLVVQAALLAVAVVPLAAWTQRVHGRQVALVVGLGYGLSWGIAEAVGFDFHEICFAVPLLSFASVALAEGRFPSAVSWAAPLVLVKEDLGLTVAAAGALVWWGGSRLLGLATVVFGVGATLLEVLVLLPANTPGGTFSAWREAHGGGGHRGGLGAFLHDGTIGLVTPETKVLLLLMLLAPTALLALRSRLILLAAPTLLWRLDSEFWQYWTTEFHYSAPLMPIAFVAFVDAMARWSPLVARARRREALAISAAVTALLVPAQPLWSAVQPATWRDERRVADAREVLARIPDGARVHATNRLAPQLTGRAEVALFGRPGVRPNPEWLAVETAGNLNWPFGSFAEQERMVEVARELGYEPVDERGDFLLLRRAAADDRQFPPLAESSE